MAAEPRVACRESAKGLALTVIDLLWDGAGEALKIKAAYKPKCNKEQCLKTWESPPLCK
jgi:hypothetical protein